MISGIDGLHPKKKDFSQVFRRAGTGKIAHHGKVLIKNMRNSHRILHQSTQEFYIRLEPPDVRPSYYMGGFKWQVFGAGEGSRIAGRKETQVKLSTRGRYAVMAMADLARYADDAEACEPVRLCEIAERQELSLSYLEQLFGKLRRGGLVVAARGPGGGYRLARPAGETRIADIIVAVDEPIKATRCKSDGSKGCLRRTGRCLTHDLWEELGRHIEVFLESVTLADVLERRVLGRSRAAGPADSPRAAA
jgi:Rrf2 family iron-sulfur cluster assembly transcriptional regulator